MKREEREGQSDMRAEQLLGLKYNPDEIGHASDWFGPDFQPRLDDLEGRLQAATDEAEKDKVRDSWLADLGSALQERKSQDPNYKKS